MSGAILGGMPRTPVCTLCKEKVPFDFDSSWVDSRSAVVMHVANCARRPEKASPADVAKIVDEIMVTAGLARGFGK